LASLHPSVSSYLLKQKPNHPPTRKLGKVIDDALRDKSELDVQLVDEVDLAVRGRKDLELQGGREGGRERGREGGNQGMINELQHHKNHGKGDKRQEGREGGNVLLT
jgi:hypothetical protein